VKYIAIQEKAEANLLWTETGCMPKLREFNCKEPSFLHIHPTVSCRLSVELGTFL